MPKVPWSALKSQIKLLDKNSLLGLVKDLYELSPQSERFLSTRFALQPKGEPRTAAYRERIQEHFYPRHGDGSIKTGPVRAMIREYRKATGDLQGTLDLMLFAVETGTDFTNDFGDIDEPFYDGLCSILGDFARLLSSPDCRGFYPTFASRLAKLRDEGSDIGWGYSDFLDEYIGTIEHRFGAAK